MNETNLRVSIITLSIFAYRGFTLKLSKGHPYGHVLREQRFDPGRARGAGIPSPIVTIPRRLGLLAPG